MFRWFIISSILSETILQVRKICRDCKKVLDYLAISEVIETMEDLVQFVRDLSPCLSKVCQDVDQRRRDLLNPYQRDNLGQHLEQVHNRLYDFFTSAPPHTVLSP